MLRYLAKHIVAANLANKVELQVAYAIGKAEPVSLFIETFNTEKVEKELIYKVIKDNFDLRPKAIIKKLELQKPVFKNTSSYGHFGVNALDQKWEKLDDLEVFKELVK